MKQEKKCCVKQFMNRSTMNETWISSCEKRWKEEICCHDCSKSRTCPFTCGWSQFPREREKCNYYLSDLELGLYKLRGDVIVPPRDDDL